MAFLCFKQNEKNKKKVENLVKQYETNDHQLSVDELAKKLQTDPINGLSKEDVQRKQLEFGKNSITGVRETPIILKFLKIMFLNIFNMLLNAGVVLCAVAYALQKNLEYIYLAAVLFGVVLITSVVTTLQNYTSSQKLKAFKDLLPQHITALRDGELASVVAVDLVPGDVIQLRMGDKLPADVRVLECTNDAKVNNSSITGESEPILRKAACTNDNPLETANLMFFGTLLVQGSAKAVVTRIGDDTLLGQIAMLTAQTKTEKTPIGKEIDHFIKIISAIAVGLGIVFGIADAVLRKNPIGTMIFVISIIVANVPEGLPATLTASLTIASQRMSRKSVLVKNLESVETLGSTSVICSDKTGTLTTNKMTVSHIYMDREEKEIDTHNPLMSDINTESETLRRLVRCAVLCNTAEFNADNVIVGDASETALIKFCHSRLSVTVQEYRKKNPKIHEISFNNKNKWHLAINKVEEEGGKFVIEVKGAPERVLSFCDRVMINGEVIDLESHERSMLDMAINSFAEMGERVFGMCERVLDDEEFPPDYQFTGDSPDDANFPFSAGAGATYVFLGFFAMIDPPRPSVPSSVVKCQQAGISVFMVTGDHPVTAKAIARKVNIIHADDEVLDLASVEGLALEDIENSSAEACVVTGQIITEFTEAMPRDAAERFWNAVLSHPRLVFSRTSPQHKLQIVEACQQRNSIVAVTGDGVNDSPALKKADLGVAMGLTGTDVAKEAAGMILMDDNFSSIVNGVEEGRVLFDNLKKSIAYTLSSNIPEIAPFLAAVIFGIPLPLKTIQIFTIDLGTDMIPAISMAFEKKESDIMLMPPRHPQKDRLVSRVMIAYSYLMIGIVQMCAAFFAYFVVMYFYGFQLKQLFSLDYKSQFESTSEKYRYLTCAMNGNFNGAPCMYHSESFAPLQNMKSDLNILNMHFNDRRDILGQANAAYVIAIVIVQIADVIISKTRRNSVFIQGLGNWVMNFGIVFEVALISFLVYFKPVAKVFSFSPLQAKFWVLATPFFMFILVFDEVRKYLLRQDFNGWVKRNTYW